MTWNNLILWISGIYLLYYLLNIAYDLARKPRLKSSAEEEVLTFSETHQPVRIGTGGEPLRDVPISSRTRDKTEKISPDSGIGFSGGVSLSELFSLFKADALQATKAIPY